MKKRITCDFETLSCSGLRKEGAYKYSLDPTTKPTCFAFKENDGRNVVTFLDFAEINWPFRDLPGRIAQNWKSFIDEGYEFSAHNAFFEIVIYSNILVKRYGWPEIPFRQWRCTAAKAAACSLPRGLEGAGSAMNLKTQKDRRGYAAMMATCKPTKQWNAWDKKRNSSTSFIAEEPPKFLSPHAAPGVWDTLYEYCKIDVLAEEELDEALPDLSPEEQEIWFLNIQLNWRGIHADIPTVRKIVGIMETESKIRLKELDSLTMGLVTKPGSRKSILDFLKFEGIELPDIRAKTVDDAIQSGKLTEDGKRLLEIRKALSKISTRKYQSFLNRANADFRIRDILLYHGASTGRDTGTGVQIQNLPKSLISQNDIDHVLGVLAETKNPAGDIDWIKLLYGDPAIVFSSLLRSMLIPSKGCELFVADFAKIEVAVLWWLAGNEAGLEVLNSGKDPYIYQASKNTGKSYEEIERALDRNEKWAFDARQLGKALILGCGFGCGARKFHTVSRDIFNVRLTRKQAKDGVDSYREANAEVPALWEQYENAAIWAVKNKAHKYLEAKCLFLHENDFLWVRLPSGRKIAYRQPQISWRVQEYEIDHVILDAKGNAVLDENGDEKVITETKFTPPRETLEFYAVNSRTKKWGIERTWGGTLTENIVQAVARDLMMYALPRLEKAKYKVLLTVHDEIVAERKKGFGSVEEFRRIILDRPLWADELLPLDAKAWRGERYKK